MPRHNHFCNSEMRDMICIFAQANLMNMTWPEDPQLYPNRRYHYNRLRNRKLLQAKLETFCPKSNHGTSKTIKKIKF
ncbi:hypothetical protein NQ318_008345 [Aromia moschata]|uniref:Uncharacterized protein n=1 Tax=Aromia moschata TaxID=1265417 RepID=A0AAV8X5P5_9CUCU|nr:hypothetical protein NQ318_008345 [Aromia moschata]